MEHLQNTFNAQRARGTRQVWFTFENIQQELEISRKYLKVQFVQLSAL